MANIDFLGEGDEEKLTGRIHGFRRGVTNYPLPGSLVYPCSTRDLREVYAGDGRSSIEVGTVYPTRDIRASIYFDQFLGKHFALLGSTGTGKSTSLALILHRICQAAPEGHVLMIDPHGEYSSAFRQTGLILDVSNLQLPYWLLNFEEHCEILLTGTGDSRQVDAEILGKCLLQARQRNRLSEAMNGRITVDSPIPYLLSDLQAVLMAEMGKLDKSTTTAPLRKPGFNDSIAAATSGDPVRQRKITSQPCAKSCNEAASTAPCATRSSTAAAYASSPYIDGCRNASFVRA